MGTLPMVTQLVSGRAETRIQTHGARGHGLNHRVPACPHTPPSLQRSLSAADRARQRPFGDRQHSRRNEASDWQPPATPGEREGTRARGASRRNDATPRLLKGAGLSRGARRRRVSEAPDFARSAESRAGQTGASGLCRLGARWTRAARGIRLGGVRSPTGGLRSGRRDGRGQRRVRSSARHAPTASAQLFPRGVPLLRRAPGPRRGGDTGAEEHPGGCQPVHQVRRGPGGPALPGARGQGEPGVSPEPLVPTPQPLGSLWSPLSAASLPADTPAGPHSLPPRRTAPMASAGPGPCPPPDPTPPGVDAGPQSPRPPSSGSHRPALAGASEPRRPPDAVLGRTRPRDREQGWAAPRKRCPFAPAQPADPG